MDYIKPEVKTILSFKKKFIRFCNSLKKKNSLKCQNSIGVNTKRHSYCGTGLTDVFMPRSSPPVIATPPRSAMASSSNCPGQGMY